MTPMDPDPTKPRRDDDNLTSPSTLDSGDDWDDDTPLTDTDTMDPDRADKIDSIMQSFCEALDSKLVLVKKEKPSSDKIDKDDSLAKVKEEKDDTDVDDDKASPTASVELKKESEADAAPEPTTSTTAAKGLALLQRFKKSVAVTPSSGPGPSSGPVAHRLRAAFRLAPRHEAPSVVSEAAVSGPSSPAPVAPVAPSPAPPPPPGGPPAPTASAAPTPSATPTAAPTSSPSASTQPPPPLPTVAASSQRPVYSHFIHIPDAAAFTSPPSHSQHAPASGAAARNLQQAYSRSPIQPRGEPQTLRARQSPNAPSAAFFHSSARSLAPQDQGWAEPFEGPPPPPLQHWHATPTQPINLGNQGPFGGPEFGTRSLDQAGVPSPNFHAPFNSPPDPLYHNFSTESLRPPGAPSSGELYPLPVPEPGGSRRQYQFGSPPSISEQESNSYHSRKSSAVSHSVAPASSPASAAAQPAIDKAPDRDGRRKRQKAATEDTIPKAGNKKFACPYYKRNRKKYCKWTSCPGPGWEEVHRVKTHLYRRHGRPPQCPRCWAVFSTDEDLQGHQQQDPPCETSHNVGLVEGYSKEQEKRLRSRKKAQPSMTDEDKWREIYMILFPDDDQDSIPSPYYDDMDSNEREEGGSGAETAGKELEDYAMFVRREMPTLVRRELEVLFEDEFKDIEERLRPRVAKIVLELQPKLLDLYKQSQLPLSEYGPQNLDHMAPGQTPGSNSETGIASTVSPTSGTDTSSTPGVVAGLKSDSGNAVNAGSETLPYLDAADFGFDPSNLDTNFAWDETQYQFHNPSTDATQYHGITAADSAGALGGSLDWSYEFDQLLNPALFVPPSANMLMQVQGDVNEGAKRKYDGN